MIKLNKKKRKRKIIWFNPPYPMNVKTNVGKTFQKLLQRHFPKLHPMHNIFNSKTVKLTYCCMRNMEFVILFTQQANFEFQQRIFWM